jgi:hypothetical protein
MSKAKDKPQMNWACDNRCFWQDDGRCFKNVNPVVCKGPVARVDPMTGELLPQLKHDHIPTEEE